MRSQVLYTWGLKTIMNKSILSMKDIRKTFSGVAVLDEVELNLNEGECLGLLGSNGAGKSTLIKILSGIYSKDKGTISILNKEVNIKNSSDSIKEGVGLLPQELSIHSEMNVAENLMMGNFLSSYKRLMVSVKKKQI